MNIPGLSEQDPSFWIHISTLGVLLLGAFIFGYLFRVALDKGRKQAHPDLQAEKEIAKKNKENATTLSEIERDQRRLEDQLLVTNRSNELLRQDLDKYLNENIRLKLKLDESERKISEGGKSVSVESSIQTPQRGASIQIDPLRKIEGIGPRIEELLHKRGILTFAQLAEADPDRLRQIMHSENPAYKVHDPGTWPQQALLASQNKWAELDELQNHLKGGKAPDPK